MRIFFLIIIVCVCTSTHAQTYYNERYYKLYVQKKQDTVYFLSTPNKVATDAKVLAAKYNFKNYRYRRHKLIPRR